MVVSHFSSAVVTSAVKEWLLSPGFHVFGAFSQVENKYNKSLAQILQPDLLVKVFV